jgi:DNA-binding FadR family transcriptional regulator
MGLFVRSHGIRLEALLECRVAVEPYLAGLAARNRTEQDLAEMRGIHQRFEQSQGDVAAYKRLNLDWHLAVARASRNEVLVALMEAISQPIFDAADYQEVTTPEIRRDAIRAHAGILHSIEIRDFKQAYSRMEKHLSAYAEMARRLLVDRPSKSTAG